MEPNRRLRSCALTLLAPTLFLMSGVAFADVTGSFAVGVNPCSGATQLCTPIPTVALPTDGVLKAQFVASTLHCSPIIAHLKVDGTERYVSGILAPGQATLVQDLGPVAAGVHDVSVQAEGVSGGCNGGYLASWSGTLTLTVSGVTDVDAEIAAPGDSVSVSTVVGGSPAPAGVAADYTRPVSAVGFATLSVATYIPPNPIIPPNPVIGSAAFVDLLLIGGNTGDTLTARFIPPNPIIPPNPVIPPNPIIPGNPVRLAFFDGTAWSPVFSSDAAPPAYTTASGFSATFTATSTPKVTALDGTVFAFVTSFGFVGFDSPLNNGALNVAKAGQAIPLKWRLYDLGGNPVTNLPAAAVHVTSVLLSCSASTGVVDAVEQYAAGASGLQNLGGGAYQFNWATSKSFAGGCRRLRLDLSESNPDGTPFYRTADFQFTR